jgi:serine/threonine protein kinase
MPYGYAVVTELGTSLQMVEAPTSTIVSEWFAGLVPSPGVYITKRMLYLVLLLHSLGIVHGDIKPSNFVILRTRELAVIDLGGSALVKQEAGAGAKQFLCACGSDTFSSAESVAGPMKRALDGFSLLRTSIRAFTGKYMHSSMSGKHDSVSSTIDLYSVGVTLNELVPYVPESGMWLLQTTQCADATRDSSIADKTYLKDAAAACLRDGATLRTALTNLRLLDDVTIAVKAGTFVVTEMLWFLTLNVSQS